MRLWTVHPKYLDPQGLIALWREALLAQAVLHAKTKGYRSHPQLERFKQHPYPLRAIAAYLLPVLEKVRMITESIASFIDKGLIYDKANMLWAACFRHDCIDTRNPFSLYFPHETATPVN